MSYCNFIKLKFNSFCWNLTHTLVNYFFGIFIKREHKINKNCYLLLDNTSGNFKANINNLLYSNFYLDKLISSDINLKINRSLMPNLKIKYLFLEPIIENLFKTKKKYNFEIWKNGSSRLVNSINRINDVIRHIASFINVKIKKLEINIDKFKVVFYNLILIKNNDKIIVKSNKIKVFFNNNDFLKINVFKMNIYGLKYISSIYIGNVCLTLREKIFRDEIVRDITNLLELIPNSDDGIAPKLYIDNLKINIEIHNYVRILINNLILEKDLIKISTINAKVFKKEIIWINLLTIDLKTNKPLIKNMRVRLFKSTGDKIYKTFIFFRKRYMHFTNCRKKLVISKTNSKDFLFDKDYLKNIVKNTESFNLTSLDKGLSIKNSYLHKYASDKILFNISIGQLDISFEKNQGKFILNNFYYKSGEKFNLISSQSWIFLKNNIKYIDKIGNNSKFLIKFGGGLFEIIPYKCYINLDLQQYKVTFSILLDNIAKIISIFTPNITTTKNYIFEKFRIDSFYTIVCYTKNSFSIGSLIEGNYSQMLNLISIEDVELLLPELVILYPNSWSEIASKIINKYFIYMSKKNLKSVIKKTPVKHITKLSTIKKSLKYVSTKIYNSMN